MARGLQTSSFVIHDFTSEPSRFHLFNICVCIALFGTCSNRNYSSTTFIVEAAVCDRSSAHERPSHVLATRRYPSSESSITACHNCVGMSDGKRLNSSLDILKRHYPQVASLRDYIYSILINATEVALVVPDDPEEYRDLLENSRVGCHQPLHRKYRAGASVFEIDEVDAPNTVSAFDLHAVRSSKGHSGTSSVLQVL